MPSWSVRRSAWATILSVLVAAALAARPAGAQTDSAQSAVELDQNVPNPFTPGFSSTIIAYRVDREASVRLTVYNLLAQEVVTLVDRVQRRGRYVVTWDGLDADGDPVPAGRYWYKLQVGDSRPLLRQMLVLEGDSPPAGQG